jgi:O-acetyl-ADP-ribose deacetylase (regulator of RNase III)
MAIRYVKGDATRPEGEGRKLICHVCNDIGGWGRGFVVALSQRWKEPERQYRRWSRSALSKIPQRFKLGNVQFVNVEEDIDVANMVAQKDIRTKGGVPPIRYGALRDCLEKVATRAIATKSSVHMPRIGCGLAGGSWMEVEKIIEGMLCNQGVEVTVYDLPSR